MKASEVIKIATAEIGYYEKASNSSLDTAAANAGSGNYTKYARDLASAGYYNGSKNGYAWCDVFVDWCFYQAAGKDKTKAEAAECQTGTLGAGCTYSAGYYKAKGRLDKEPKAGDQIFFQSGGEIVHTGLVVAVSSSTVTTIEGNSGNMVKKNSYSRSSSYINSYGHPLYDDAEADAEEETEDGDYSGEMSVEMPLLKKGDSGPAVKFLQSVLILRGDTSLKADGEFGTLTKTALVKLQKELWPKDSGQWDGECGAAVWKALVESWDV